jgi:hypothetical protein
LSGAGVPRYETVVTLRSALRSFLLTFLLPACAYQSGQVAATRGTIAIIGTGTANIFYMVDQATRTCWLSAGQAIAPLDCCHLANVAEARASFPWLSDECTNAAPANAEPAPSPPPPSSTDAPVRPPIGG